MDDKYLKFLGTYIIAIVGALFVAIGVVLGEIPLKPQWVAFLVVFMGATETLLIAIIRIYFKLPEEELDPIPENETWIAHTSGDVTFWTNEHGEVMWEDPNVTNTT